MNRADRMYAVLKDGKWHSHREITTGGPWFLCNNAASDLRVKRGLNVEYKKLNGVPCYRLIPSVPEPAWGGSQVAGRVDDGEGEVSSESGAGQLFETPRGAYDSEAA